MGSSVIALIVSMMSVHVGISEKIESDVKTKYFIFVFLLILLTIIVSIIRG